MKLRHVIPTAILMLLVPLFALAQGQTQPQEEPAKTWGDYTVRGSVEFGGHIAETGGNDQMYSTLVDINSGPRLLEQEFSMQSRSRVGGLFDNLYSSSFGFGGDPEGMARLRLEKDRWYNFVALYRRDKNIFDYDLFANPMNLNPGIVTCGTGCSNVFTPTALPWYSNTTRLMAETRNMGDFSLTLFPQSKVSVRLGYARNATYGAMFTSMETPIRTILGQDSQWKSDRYQGGVDLKFLPRTTISLDFFWEHDKNDIGFADANVFYNLGNTTGPLADIGLLYPPVAGTLTIPPGGNTCPTSASPLNPSAQTIPTAGVFIIDPGCNGILLNTGPGGAFFRHANLRTDIPTGQLSFQSGYFRNLDLSGSVTYSSATSDFLNFNEFSHGNTAIVTTGTNPTSGTSNASLNLISASPTTDRISANADFGATYHINKSWSVSDKFRFLNWRQHGASTLDQLNCFLPPTTANPLVTPVATPTGFPAGAVTLTPVLNPCNSTILSLAGLTAAGNAATGAYENINAFTTLFGERSYFNTFKVNWQPTRRFSGYVGYRFARRSFQDGNGDITGIYSTQTTNLANDGSGNVPTPTVNPTVLGDPPVDSEEFDQHTFLAGIVFRPADAWRINADLEWLSSQPAFILIYPRHQQRARIYSTYKAAPWITFHGGIHLVESRNDFAAGETVEDTATPLFPSAFIPAAYGHTDHWRYYTAGTTLTRNRWTFDFGWTMQDQSIASATCMPLPDNAFGTNIPKPLTCALSGSTDRALRLDYQETTHSGYFNLSFQPVKRVTLNLGYDVTSDNGHTFWLRSDSLTPLLVLGDIYGNSPPLAGNPITPCPGASVPTGCVFQGPFPDQPLGPQATIWHKGLAGIAVDVVQGIQFKGEWNYYDYNAKDHTPGLAPVQVVAPRDFHASVGTVSLRYSF